MSNHSSQGLRKDEHIVIVGASLAGLRAAEALRRRDFAGQITIVGDEKYAPYDRPPLSKHVLTGHLPIEHTPLAMLEDVRATWILGVAATALDVEQRQLSLSNGERLHFDQLLIATGTRARPWPEERGGKLDGVFLIRDRDDSQQLRERLARKPGRVLIAGGGFIGCEVASVCRELDLEVTLVERGPTPLYGALGSSMGSIVARLQQQHGVDLRTRTTVESFEGDAAGRLCRARLSDGSVVEIDVAIVALGALHNTEWLQGSGLAADERGLVCDTYSRVLDAQGQVVEGIFTAGDVARWPQHLCDGDLIAVEHWGNAVDQAENAAGNMLSAETDYRAYKHIPAFWSSQFGINIKAVGLPNRGDEVMVTQGSVERYRFVAAYGRQGRIIAAVSFDQGRWLEAYNTLIEEGATYPPQLAAADQPENMQSQPAGFPAMARHA
ncbi:pyridine nucleotide-disulfide oxidoreductase [Dictyobacter vulcani]|uniref:Pyridine nucleotide-disulfide oxidoreductase n=1 Tax=Dictyobacter vulcani TaxID=2607529 RepID=A0A5J4KZL9_9CHLR|nr:FAD-dependent oxidoreductase [Dictyobacter vulcani]GER90666.1 pyridine nucleotide-disulfide oxidoreductase [Dictyobacter vulcani]